ncbi:virulence factor TspB C-terminal domain-related protein [Stenotrophomonas maltophilia]|uniref:Transmembrane protein n=1 Tax=Stenotrophomonas maltophilia TaxID=40324 RepID=A0AAD0BTR2_STEMA|nr:virulence factor TspB C-terminal domain-related protein [Stenotrophomonas maltophilia]AUI07623.1 hypothetical protein SmaCSM2_10670 [Stenotrophomonas maltophilia]
MAGGLRDHLCGLQLMLRLMRSVCTSGASLLAIGMLFGLLSFNAYAAPFVLLPSEGEASARCEANRTASQDAFNGQPNPPSFTCKRTKDSLQIVFSCVRAEAGVNGICIRDGDTYMYGALLKDSCENQPEYTGQGPWSNLGGSARSGSIGCRNGCDGMWGKNADSTFTWTPTGVVCPADEKKNCEQPELANAGYYWNVALSVCEPPKPQCEGGKNPNSLGQCAPEPCPDGMASQADGTCKKKDNECPAGQVRSPDGKCLPGDGQCASGEVRGPDGTCKKDGDGDGKPDEPGDKDTFSGGDDCSSPPSCSGSPIMCGQARIQWRIDCNTRKNRNIAGGLCNAMPVCTGEKCDAMEYAGLLMQWRSACALEKMASDSGNSGGNADVKAIRDALTGSGGSVTTPADRPASDVWSPSSGQPTRPDTSGYGWGRGCPQPPAIEVMGQTIAFDITPLCRWLGLGSYFVVGLAALFCLRIIASKDA